MSEITDALERIFSADSSVYQQRGFQRRVGFGERPALINIDLANAWTRPGNPFSCDEMDVIIPGRSAPASRIAREGPARRLHDHGVRCHGGAEQRHGDLEPEDSARGRCSSERTRSRSMSASRPSRAST